MTNVTRLQAELGDAILQAAKELPTDEARTRFITVKLSGTVASTIGVLSLGAAMQHPDRLEQVEAEATQLADLIHAQVKAGLIPVLHQMLNDSGAASLFEEVGLDD